MLRGPAILVQRAESSARIPRYGVTGRRAMEGREQYTEMKKSIEELREMGKIGVKVIIVFQLKQRNWSEDAKYIHRSYKAG